MSARRAAAHVRDGDAKPVVVARVVVVADDLQAGVRYENRINATYCTVVCVFRSDGIEPRAAMR